MRTRLLQSYRMVPALLVLVCSSAIADSPPSPALPGHSFQSTETQRREADEGANPGFLWVEQGQELWTKAEGSAGKSCASCHGEDGTQMRGVAARYPAVDARSGKLVNLEQRINQ